jgi:hypothetical protein
MKVFSHERISTGILYLRLSSDFRSTQDIMMLNFPGKKAFKTSTDDYPMRSSARVGNGLKIHFDGNSKIHPYDRCTAMSFLVHSPYDVPAAFEIDEMVQFLYGYDLEVSIIPEITNTDESLRSVDPQTRSCYFEGEKQLKYFKVYSRRNCEHECISNYIEKNFRFNCTPFHYLRTESQEVCDHRFEVKLRLQMGYLLKSANNFLQKCNCLDECNFIKYRTEIIAHRNPIRESFFWNFDFEVSVEFKFKDIDVFPLRRYRQMTFSDFLAQSG